MKNSLVFFVSLDFVLHIINRGEIVTYTVKSGDTLYGISNQFGVSVSDLTRLNNLSSSVLQIGQILTIPTNTGTNPDNTFTYTVKKGDSLYSIASLYGTNVNTLISLNNLKSNSLSIGQKLLVPEKYQSPITVPNYTNYTVKKGDSLYSIARKFNVSIDTIIKDNSLNSNNLSIGQNLKIRTSTPSIGDVEEECFGIEYIPPSNISTINYTVKKGDSLYKIANQYNTSVSELIRLNNLTTSNLSIGQILKVPTSGSSSGTSTRTYTVQKGDSLYSIAKKFNTTVDSIKRKNNLKTNLLSVGQKINI